MGAFIWRVFSAKRTEADYQAWRHQRDWTARKYAMWGRGERLPAQLPSRSRMAVNWKRRFDEPIEKDTLR
jgi:hypothetical protein